MITDPQSKPKINNFDNTTLAFAYKSDKDLKKAYRLFSMMQYNWLVWLGTRLTPWAIRIGLPIKKIIRNTLFKQFVGGETLQATTPVVNLLAQHNVQVILDYGAEGKENEESFEAAKNTFVQVIEFAASQKNIPFISIKLTAIASFSLLEKLHGIQINQHNNNSYENILANEERMEWEKVQERLLHICTTAKENNIGVLIDAEESWIQGPIDLLAMQMMQKFNSKMLGEKAVVYNTIQLYRTDRLSFLQESLNTAQQNNYVLGVKLVRGAYMEKERNRARALHYSSPIQPTKSLSDKDYNDAIHFCIDHIDQIATIIASHNEKSNLLAAQLLEQKQLPLHNPNMHFSQLYGMSDHISFNLAKANYSVSKYIPFGPIKDVVPYLMRRAQENSSVKGQTGRELSLLRKEIKRRKIL